MNKWKNIWLLALLFATNAHANSCKIDGYAIGFFNGVATPRYDAVRNMKKIKSTLDIGDYYNGEPVEYQLFYNDSNIEANNLNVLADFAETFEQRTQELVGTSFDRWEAFWEIINGRQDSSIIQKISAAFSWFAGFVQDIISVTLNGLFAEFLGALELLIDAPESSDTIMRHELINDTNTWKGKKLIYIAHSQGNLWMNKAYDYVTSQSGYDGKNIHVLHIAPASTTLSPNSDYILSTSDIVINLLHLSGLGSVPNPNITLDYNSSDPMGHGLSEIYLTHPDSIKAVKASVRRSFLSLTKPDMEDFLFSIDYEYSTNFKLQHDSPQFAFVDSNEHGDYSAYPSYDYLVGDWLSYTLSPTSTVEPLLFSLNNKEDKEVRINIESCLAPNENNNSGVLHEVGSFLFADFSNITALRSPLHMTASRTVRDRYGNQLVDVEQDVSPYYAGGYARCVGSGALFELIANQKHYTSKQKTELEKLKLSGRYQIGAKLSNYLCHIN